MLSKTVTRIEHNTAPAVNLKLQAQLKESISKYIGADRSQIDRRLGELDREWDVERLIEAEAPVTIILGISLGLLHDRKWFAVSAFAATMVIFHSVQGWYPMLPLLRRMGIRSQAEIEQERHALRVLRGDHEAYRTQLDH